MGKKKRCKDCVHYDFFLMVTSGPYGYSGFIPCLTCNEFLKPQDNFEEKKEPPQ